ncbi:MAG: glycosyltransferase [Phycisphaerales bacterium]|nr:glycosyltransferase [Phycisphaerales bacterium]
MKILILADEIFAMRERAMLSRLELGLADEGIRVIHALPESASHREPAGVFSRSVAYETSKIGPLRRMLARRLAATIRDPEAEEDDQPVSIIHVFGGSVWDLGLDLATELDSELVLELWRPALRERAEALAAARREKPWPVFAVPDPMIERQISDKGSRLTVRTTPWGVHMEDQAHRLLPPDRVPAAVIIGGGHDRAACTAALQGLAQVIPHHREFMIFIDSRVIRRGDLWPIAKRLGLLPSITLIEDIEDRRDLLTQADLLILPEARGENHSIVLEAMAAPMALIAAADPSVGTLIDGRTAMLIPKPDPGLWTTAIRSLLSDPDRTNALALSARDYIRQERSAFRHIKSVLDLYQWMTSSASIPIREQSGTASPI